MDPSIPLYFSGAHVFFMIFLYFFGLLWLYPLPGDMFSVPLFTKKTVEKFKATDRGMQGGWKVKLGLFILRVISLNCAGLYRHLRSRNILVVVWVLNDPEEWEEALSYGDSIDGVMTDWPEKLIEWFQSR